MNQRTKAGYVVKVDTLPETTMMARDLRERLTEIRTLMQSLNLMDVNELAKQLYEHAHEYELRYGVRPGQSPSTIQKKRFHVLMSCNILFVTSYQARTVDNDVRLAIKGGATVFFYSPYKTPDLIELSGAQASIDWDNVIANEIAQGKQYAIHDEYVSVHSAIDSTLVTLLNTKTPWLGNGTRLYTILDEQFDGNFNQFIDYCNGRIAEIEDLGDYDVDYGTTMVLKEKMSTSHFVASKGKEKGRRTFWATDTPDIQQYWANYETLAINTLQKFIHITYLYSIDYKPLTRMYTVDGVEYGDKNFCKQYGSDKYDIAFDCDEDYDGTEIWAGSAQEDILRSTPIYQDRTTDEDLMVQEAIAHSFDFTNATYNDTPIVDWDMRKTTLADYVRNHPVRKTGRNGYSKVYPKSASDIQ